MAQSLPLVPGLVTRLRQWRRGAGQRAVVQADAADYSDTAMVAHELRTPVSCMIGFADLLLASDLTADQREQARMIAKSGRHLLALVNGLLAEEQREHGRHEPPCDLRELLANSIALFEPTARAKGLQLGQWIDPALPRRIAADPVHVQQIMFNLIGNAIKFTQHGGVDIEVRVIDQSEKPQVLIAVIDSGIGIAEDRLAHIFAPFAQADSSIALRFGGNGLGLAISRRLATTLDGHLTAHSQPGVGSNITLTLPLAECGKAQSPALPSIAHSNGHALSGERVLIAEDDGISRRLLLALAASLGLEVHFAADGAEVLHAVGAAKAADRPFRAVLMDLHMPVMSGLETTRRLRALGHAADSLPVIALTAACRAEDIAAAHAAGMQAHLAKPVTALALARELARFLPAGLAEQQLDEGSGFPSSAPLQERYLGRKRQLLASLRQALDGRPALVDWDTITSELHRLAGVAAHFGERELGDTARRLEHRLRLASEASQQQDELRRAWPLIAQVA